MILYETKATDFGLMPSDAISGSQQNCALLGNVDEWQLGMPDGVPVVNKDE